MHINASGWAQMVKMHFLDFLVFLQKTLAAHISAPRRGTEALPGAALPHFGRDGKDGDTCFFAHLISFLAIFSRFFPLCHRILLIVSPVLKYLKLQV